MVTQNAIAFKIKKKLLNPYAFTVTLDGNLYNFSVKWNDYARCAFLWLYDADMKPIVLGSALTNGTLIRTDRRLLPQDLRFVNINGESYEPDLNNISKEFAFVYGS